MTLNSMQVSFLPLSSSSFYYYFCLCCPLYYRFLYVIVSLRSNQLYCISCATFFFVSQPTSNTQHCAFVPFCVRSKFCIIIFTSCAFIWIMMLKHMPIYKVVYENSTNFSPVGWYGCGSSSCSWCSPSCCCCIWWLLWWCWCWCWCCRCLFGCWVCDAGKFILDKHLAKLIFAIWSEPLPKDV